MIKELWRTGIAITKDVISTIAETLRTIGWSPVQIVLAIQLLRNPYTFKQQLMMKGVEMLPDIGAAIIKSWRSTNAVAMPATVPAGKGYLGRGVFNMGAGYKRRRRGRFVKGSPEAKAYMAYLRSLRRS